MIIQKEIQSFFNAFRGLGLVLMERHMRFHFIMFLGAVALGRVFQITPMEWIAIFLTGALVIVAECLNSALERLCNHLHPERHTAIGRVKDVAAGGVLFAAMVAFIVGLMIFLPYVWKN
jgi:diacylglycerol kinase